MKAGCTWLASSRPALQADICSSHNTRGRVGIAFRLSNQGNLQPTEPRIPPEAISPEVILPISHMWMTRPSAAKHASATVSERVGWAWTELCRSSRVASSVRANVASAIISVASGPII